MQITQKYGNRLLYVREQLNELLEKDPTAVAIVLQKEQRIGEMHESELKSYQERMQNCLLQALEKAQQNKNWNQAIALWHTINIIMPDQQSSNLADFYAQLILQQYHADNYVLAGWYLKRYISFMQLYTAEQRTQLFHADITKLQTIVPDIIDYSADDVLYVMAKKLGWDIVEPQFNDLSTLQESIVLVWMDKGTVLQDGAFVPLRELGTAFLIDKSGYYLSNYHVIASEVDQEYKGYSRLYIRYSDMPEYRVPAEVIGYDPLLDIALIKGPSRVNAHVLPINEYKRIVGQKLHVVGSPGGLYNTVTAGVLSAINRELLSVGTLFQLDASINPGNSGGPILGDNNMLLGMSVASAELFEGVNFAIPSDWIYVILPQLYKKKQVSHPWIGVSIAKERSQGLRITYVIKNSPADKAGLQVGDIITHINDLSVSMRSVAQMLLLKIGNYALINISYIRTYEDENSVQNMNSLVYLAERPVDPYIAIVQTKFNKKLLYPFLGIQVASVGSTYVVHDVIAGSVGDELGVLAGDEFIVRHYKYNKKTHQVEFFISFYKKSAAYLPESIQMSFNIKDAQTVI